MCLYLGRDEALAAIQLTAVNMILACLQRCCYIHRPLMDSWFPQERTLTMPT